MSCADDIDEVLEPLFRDSIVPETLVEADTLIKALLVIRRDADKAGEETRFLAATRAIACLRAGSIHQIADALVSDFEVITEIEDED